MKRVEYMKIHQPDEYHRRYGKLEKQEQEQPIEEHPKAATEEMMDDFEDED